VTPSHWDSTSFDIHADYGRVVVELPGFEHERVSPASDDWRAFHVRMVTAGGRQLKLAINLNYEKRDDESLAFRLTAGDRETGEELVVGDRGPGCSFVLERSTLSQHVRDLRLYIDSKELRRQGFGFAIVSFIKAFFFPFRAATPISGGKPASSHINNLTMSYNRR
jgi:hypothetical protein